MSCKLSPEQIEATTRFHGHWCPGLAIGIRASEWALAEMGRAGDEEIVAVVETDMCGVDAIQFLTGCTLGKGNLIHRDYGKNAFSFYRRRDGKSARLVTRPGIHGDTQGMMARLHRKMQREGLTPEEEKSMEEMRAAMSQRVMTAELDALFDIGEAPGPVPRKARILTSRVCDACGEPVMESRTRQARNQTLCIPCFERRSNQQK